MKNDQTLKQVQGALFNNDRSVEDSRQKPSGMTLFNNGFTLIELLVVVLIIGILAAVALPQYQKAVEKSKAAQAMALLTSVYQAVLIYQQANGKWPTEFEQLDVDIALTGNTKGWNTWGEARSNEDWALQLRTHAGFFGVVAVRLTGAYRGGLFLIYGDQFADNLPKDALICGELKKGDFKFQKQPGDFCVKIWKGSFLLSGDETRLYSF